jgi:2-amino-4-hydroxy-6-hydroxymethyldihydropteridine diphosphokinase
LILYGEEIIDEDGLQIPRDEIERYAFVLEPLAEIAAEQHHPVSGISYAELWQKADKTDLKQHKVQTNWLK